MLAGSWSSVVNITNSTLKGNKGGAVHLLGSRATLTDCTFTSNIVATSGGAVVALDSHLEVRNSTFKYNQARAWLLQRFADKRARGFGGAFFGMDSTVTMESCTFVENTALEGGAVWVGGRQPPEEFVCSHGCVGPIDTTTLHMYNTTLHNNSAANGGALRAAVPTEVIMEDVTFTENNAGVAALEGSNMLFQYLKKAGLNQWYQGVGGAILSEMATMRISGSRLENNSAISDGGE
jgi:hypothetical protein